MALAPQGTIASFAGKAVKCSLGALVLVLFFLFADVPVSAASSSRSSSRSNCDESLAPEQFFGTTSAPKGIRVFRGTVTRDGDRYVLKDAAGGRWFELDDQQTAAKFVDKQVKITGTLDKAKDLIRIQSIQEATAKITHSCSEGAARLAPFRAEGPESDQS
jgi:uncharacterized protein YdeI (BOF family)